MRGATSRRGGRGLSSLTYAPKVSARAVRLTEIMLSASLRSTLSPRHFTARRLLRRRDPAAPDSAAVTVDHTAKFRAEAPASSSSPALTSSARRHPHRRRHRGPRRARRDRDALRHRPRHMRNTPRRAAHARRLRQQPGGPHRRCPRARSGAAAWRAVPEQPSGRRCRGLPEASPCGCRRRPRSLWSRHPLVDAYDRRVACTGVITPDAPGAPGLRSGGRRDRRRSGRAGADAILREGPVQSGADLLGEAGQERVGVALRDRRVGLDLEQ